MKNKIVKVVVYLVAIFISLVMCFGFLIYLKFDFNWNANIILVCFLSIALILSIWSSKHKKKSLIACLILLIIIIINVIYFKFFSMKIEPLIYMHNKYNISYSDMEILETHKKGDNIGNNDSYEVVRSLRTAEIKYDDCVIILHYLDGWKDDYNEQLNYKSNNQTLLKEFNSVLETYTEDYMLYVEPIWNYNPYYSKYDYYMNDYSIITYDIFLYCMEEEDLSNLIEMLDNYILNNKAISIRYELNIIKDQELYNQIKQRIDSSSSLSSILHKIGYSIIECSDSSAYDKDIFINNADEYNIQKSSKYKYIVFSYISTKHKLEDKLSTHFTEYGVNEKGTQE